MLLERCHLTNFFSETKIRIPFFFFEAEKKTRAVARCFLQLSNVQKCEKKASVVVKLLFKCQQTREQ